MSVKKISLLVLLSVLSIEALAADKLIFALDIIRHGDRTPLTSIPKAPHKWSGDPGQLTPLGMQQEYQLGVKMHKRYIEKSHLLPANYQQNTLYVRSTDYDRTLMSAQSLLLGLYPLGTGPQLSSGAPALPSRFQPVPIHAESKDHTVWLFADSDDAYFGKLLDQYVVNRPEWQAKLNELKPHFSRWSEITGAPLHDLYDVGDLSDSLYIYKLNHIPYPKGLTNQDADKIIQAGQWAFMDEWTPEMGRVTGHKLMLTIGDYFTQVVKEHSPLKFVLISGHDSTILSAMSAMQVPIKDAPPHYASNLSYLLYEVQPNEYVVKVIYNDKPVKLACGYACPLAEFLHLIS